MDKLLIKGGTRLVGDVTISGAKNAALPILAGALLASEPVTIANGPQLKDVATMCTLLQSMGVEVTSDGPMNVRVTAHNVSARRAPCCLVKSMRAPIPVPGPLRGRFGVPRSAHGVAGCR